MKTALITGATDGIGKQTALNIASENNHVIIIGRDSTKCKLVCDEISNKTNNNNVEYFTFDLSLISDNKALATKIKNNFNKIDILINNVGAMFTKYQETKEGFEKTFALNHLGPFTLTIELLDLLLENNSSRIVNVSSAAHYNVIDGDIKQENKRTFIEKKFFRTEFDINNLQRKNNYKGTHQYSCSKLMNILFTYKLASSYLENKNITINCLHPGFVASKFGHNNGGILKTFFKFAQRVQALSLVDGAKSSTYAALSNDLDNMSGIYIDEDCSVIESSSLSYNKELQNKLWEQSLSLINTKG